MKSSYRVLSTVLLCLPYLCVSLLSTRLPLRVVVHFSEDGQPDRFVPRQVWFNLLSYVMFALLLLRLVIIARLSQRSGLSSLHFARIYLLSAALVGSVPGHFVLWAYYPSPSFFNYVPVLVALLGAGGVYFTTPADLPASDELTKSVLAPRQIAILQQLHSLSRLVVVRVNVLAALLMLFARSEDRWAIGIWANLLAFIAMSIMAAILHRQSS